MNPQLRRESSGSHESEAGDGLIQKSKPNDNSPGPLFYIHRPERLPSTILSPCRRNRPQLTTVLPRTTRAPSSLPLRLHIPSPSNTSKPKRHTARPRATHTCPKYHQLPLPPALPPPATSPPRPHIASGLAAAAARTEPPQRDDVENRPFQSSSVSGVPKVRKARYEQNRLGAFHRHEGPPTYPPANLLNSRGLTPYPYRHPYSGRPDQPGRPRPLAPDGTSVQLKTTRAPRQQTSERSSSPLPSSKRKKKECFVLFPALPLLRSDVCSRGSGDKAARQLRNT